MSEFKEGIYDQLVTRRLRRFLDRQSVLKSSVDALEETDCPDYLARHLIRQIKATLRGMPTEDCVRTEAGRLRGRLAEYYVGEGKDDEIVIELPKGGYLSAA
jgi:hypothetical protein